MFSSVIPGIQAPNVPISALQPYCLQMCQIIELGKPAPHYLQSMPRERPSAWRGIALLGAIQAKTIGSNDP
jgi:hypothetical protein